MRAHFPGYLQIEYSRLLLARHGARLRAAHGQGDRGASAIELAIITAILVGLAVGVLLVVQTVVTSRKTQITSNNNGIP
jgi:Flp pilus assembly pilin Flp